MHLPEDDLNNILLTSARHLDRNIQLLERGGQGPDHPVHPAIARPATSRALPAACCRTADAGLTAGPHAVRPAPVTA
jgi:23S rRNA (cytosine1962-C5)-methyltransferase